jgi:hypothetical protein
MGGVSLPRMTQLLLQYVDSSCHVTMVNIVLLGCRVSSDTSDLQCEGLIREWDRTITY